MNYNLNIQISNETDADALNTLSHLRDTYAANVAHGSFQSHTRLVTCKLAAATFEDAVNILTALKNTFTTRLIMYNINFSGTE